MKTKILDTNVLLNRPLSETVDMMLSEDAEGVTIIIPFVVLEELDRHKSGPDISNVNCRASIRFINQLISDNPGQLTTGIKYKNAIIQVHTPDDLAIGDSKADYQIINTARSFGQDAVLVTEDVHERVIADILNIKSESACNSIDLKHLYSGITDMKLSAAQTKELEGTEKLPVKKKLAHNQFVKIKKDDKTTSYAIFDGEEGCIEPLPMDWNIGGFTPKRNKADEIIPEQSMLMFLLMDPDVQIITCNGPSGCGKTFLTLIAAMQQTLQEEAYKKIIVMRPLVAIGEKLGALPGDKTDKLTPWMASTYDNLEVILETMRLSTYKRGDPQGIIDEMMQDGVLEIESMSYIRGRSIPGSFIIIDDAQNLTVKQAVSILTRAGDGSKIVFLGDINENQIDDPKLNPLNNGLTFLIDSMQNIDSAVGHVTMHVPVRSKIAEIGVKIGDKYGAE